MSSIGSTARVCVLLGMLLAPTACDRKIGGRKGSDQSNTIDIQAQASAFHETPMLGSGSEYPFYSVLLKLTNCGSRPFVFDKMVVAWNPGNGKMLTGTSTPGDSGDAFQIEPGETKEYWESSGDRTILLLRDAGGKPLRFQVTLSRNGKVVLGPLSAPLPQLASLKDIHADGKAAGTPLTLSEDRP